ncbi:MAG: TonB-dependent receptor plug domain-containing protein, partial [Pseudomonadota bacterium]
MISRGSRADDGRATAESARSAREARLTVAVQLALVAGVVGATTSVAQESAIEEVIATGSRVVRQELETTVPVTVINAEAVLDSGETDVAALLRETPALNGSLTGTNSVSTGFDSDLGDDTGVGRLNLRNLGTDRTLVLVNGRRHVGAIQGAADVDVSTIPIALIDRVETLTGGSSAVYGADAVTGVVNFVMKEDFEGVDYRLQGGITGEGDGDSLFASVVAGTNFAGDRGNVTVAFEFTSQGVVRAEDRDDQVNEGFFSLLSNSPELSAAFNRDPNASNVFVPNFRINFSSSGGIIALREAGQGGSVFGGLIDGDNDFGVIPGVPALQVVDGNTVREFNRGIESNPFEASGGDGIETTNPFEVIAPSLERFNFNAFTNYDLTDTFEVYTELKFVRTESVDADGIPFNDDIPIALDNAFIPADLQAQIDAAIADGITPAITLSRDILDEAVIPTQLTDRNTFRAVGGVRANLANGWVADVSYNYGRTDINTIERNSRVEDRFFAAVDAVVDPDSGEIVCRSDLDPDTIPPSSPFPSSREGFLTFAA